MMRINQRASDPNFSTFMWHHRHIFMSLSLALPIVLQIGSIAIKVFKNPEIISNKFFTFKQFVISSFKKDVSETEDQFKKRLLKNVILVSSLALGISTCVSLPFVVLPLSFAIP
ncbi:MAG: hypothetical protein K940chlam6_01557 [Chlamydiae bacterium]|nr:hypothetical protein [Chlamydiota bacterium]